nr:C39 family peptidase [Mycobacterium sp. UM_CSW]
MKIASITKTAVVTVAAGAIALGVAGTAGAASGATYGDPDGAAKWWRHQKYDDCVLMAAADVVGQVTGKEPSEEAIIKKAQSTPSTIHPGSIYIKPSDTRHPGSGQGTMFADVPTLLAQYKVDAVATDRRHAAASGVPGGIAGIEQELGTGHKVIVSVNGELIWNVPVETKDENGKPQGDHAVVVTGVDTGYGIVHLNDSGDPKGRDAQIPMALFLKAWDASDQLIVVTT